MLFLQWQSVPSCMLVPLTFQFPVLPTKCPLMCTVRALRKESKSQCEFTLCLRLPGLLFFYDSPHLAFSSLLKFYLVPFYVCIGSLFLPPMLYHSWDWLSILFLPTCKLILLGFQGIWLLHSFKGSCLQ